MNKHTLFDKIRHLPIDEEKDIDRFPPEIDELSLILAKETATKISQGISIKLNLEEWLKLQAIIQAQLAYTIRRIKFTPPPYPQDFIEQSKE